MTKHTRILLLTLAAGLVAAAAQAQWAAYRIAAAEVETVSGEACIADSCGDRCQELLSLARQYSSKYLNENVALADGFVADRICVALPGVGAMGYHYPNLERMADTEVNVRYPEILLFAALPNGGRRLIGVEYFVPVISNGQPWRGSASEPPPTIDNAVPVLFGQAFNGPMPGHNPSMPWHYDLHVWAWRHNPAGTFSQWNPKVSCAN